MYLPPSSQDAPFRKQITTWANTKRAEPKSRLSNLWRSLPVCRYRELPAASKAGACTCSQTKKCMGEAFRRSPNRTCSRARFGPQKTSHNFREARVVYIMPPMPPMSGIAGAPPPASLFGASATMASVVIRREATDAAS